MASGLLKKMIKKSSSKKYPAKKVKPSGIKKRGSPSAAYAKMKGKPAKASTLPAATKMKKPASYGKGLAEGTGIGAAGTYAYMKNKDKKAAQAKEKTKKQLKQAVDEHRRRTKSKSKHHSK